MEYNACNNLREENRNKYIYTSKKVIHDNHDISIRNILMDKKEAIIFINDTLKLARTKEEIKKEDLELYNNRYITTEFLNRETDIIYKIKEKDIFILIEHQSKIDYNMPRRMVEYKIEIIRQYIDKSKKKEKSYKTPLVIGIVLYTGKKKWDVSKTIEETEIKLEGIKEESFGRYLAVDVNEYKEKEMLDKKGALYKIILIDRAENKEDTEERYEKVLKSKLLEEDKEKIEKYANNILTKILGENKLKELTKKYIKGGSKEMLVETLKREIRNEKRLSKKEGKIQGLKLVAKEMLKNNEDIELIKKYTGLSSNEIEKISK